VLVAIQDAASGAGLPQALYLKARHPEKFYVFAGLNHGARLSKGEVSTPGRPFGSAASLARQVTASSRWAATASKMIEGKPTWRQTLDIPVTDPTSSPTGPGRGGRPASGVARQRPEEFWDPELTPEWASPAAGDMGPRREEEDLYARWPRSCAAIRACGWSFAHFYFPLG